MKNQFDLHKLIAKRKIENELELERALVADRKLRLLAKENPELKTLRKQLRDLIAEYEDRHWSKNSASDERINESDEAEIIAEKERVFIQKRKEIIKERLKSLDMSQQQLGAVLGHNSKSYMSELMNGISPFTLRDLVAIHRLLNIDLEKLVPTILPKQDRERIEFALQKINNPKLQISAEDLETS